MSKSISIILTFVLLACPYLCLGEQAAGGECPHFDCRDDCQSAIDLPDDDHASPTPHACEGCVHAIETVPGERPSEVPRRSSQCLCRGAVASAEVRLPEVDQLPATGAFAGVVFQGSDESERTGWRTASPVFAAHASGRAICVRVCALLI